MRGQCECCGKREIVEYRMAPEIHIRVGMCQMCINARIIPYDMLTFVTAIQCDFDYDEQKLSSGWMALMHRTLTYFRKTHAEFESDVNGEFNRFTDELLPREEI